MFSLDGQQVGEFFGGSLTADDYDGNGASDLVVGAPTHNTESGDVGCVYIYKGVFVSNRVYQSIVQRFLESSDHEYLWP